MFKPLNTIHLFPFMHYSLKKRTNYNSYCLHKIINMNEWLISSKYICHKILFVSCIDEMNVYIHKREFIDYRIEFILFTVIFPTYITLWNHIWRREIRNAKILLLSYYWFSCTESIISSQFSNFSSGYYWENVTFFLYIFMFM